MYSDDTTYKNLVIAGAKLVKDLKALDKANSKNVEAVYKDGYNIFEAIKILVNVAADISTEDKAYYDMAQIFYADTVSVYAYNHDVGEKYYELLWKWNEGDKDAEVEFEKLGESIPENEHYWLRRYTYSKRPSII